MIEVEIGKKLPLSLQVYDGDASLKVTAIIVTNTGEEVARSMCVSAGAGLYLSDGVLMPDCLFCVARYETDQPEKYEVASDVFKAIAKEPPPAKKILGEVIARERVRLIQGVIK